MRILSGLPQDGCGTQVDRAFDQPIADAGGAAVTRFERGDRLLGLLEGELANGPFALLHPLQVRLVGGAILRFEFPIADDDGI